MYAAIDTEPYPDPGRRPERSRPASRQEVSYRTREQPGTIVVDPDRAPCLSGDGGRSCAPLRAPASARKKV